MLLVNAIICDGDDSFRGRYYISYNLIVSNVSSWPRKYELLAFLFRIFL